MSRYRAGGASQQHGKGPDVHELRIAGKLLRYTLELAEPLGYQLSPSVLKSFKQLQEALGLWHDDVVLGERALFDRARADAVLPPAAVVWSRARAGADAVEAERETPYAVRPALGGSRRAAVRRHFTGVPSAATGRTGADRPAAATKGSKCSDGRGPGQSAKPPGEPADADSATTAAPETSAAAPSVSHDPEFARERRKRRMKLYLLRHAEAEDGADDPRRRLTRKGRRDAKALGKTLGRHKLRLRSIWHSGYDRAARNRRGNRAAPPRGRAGRQAAAA